MTSETILVAQGGGPTAVINQSLVGVVLEARRFAQVERVYGALLRRARHRQRRLGRPDAGNQRQPGTGRRHAVFGAGLDARQARPQVLPRNLQGAAGARASAISSTSAATIRPTRCASSARRRSRPNYPLRCIHIPKTIDNDLVGNDHTPGYPSAARFVAQAFAGANLDNAALPGVYIGVVMGRHAGFLTAAAALGRKVPGRWSAPDLPARTHLRAGALPGRRARRSTSASAAA